MRAKWSAVLVSLVLIGCAGKGPGVDLASLQVPGGRSVAADANWRTAPGGALEWGGGARQQAGIALIPDGIAYDLEMNAELRPGKGAAGVILRATGQSVSSASFHAVTLHEGGATLWLRDGDAWRAVHNCLVPVDPSAEHTLRVRAHGDTIAVALDGRKLFTARNVRIDHPGRFGVCCSGGQCAVVSLRCRILDNH